MSERTSYRAVCRILNKSSCGSGSICGIDGSGHAYILTNAHVAGSRVGRTVKVFVESQGDNITAKVVMAAYSDKTLADWAVLKTDEPYTKVKPVLLSKKRPSGTHYSKGFPRCKAMQGQTIKTYDMSDKSALWRWSPNSIGGQSGSGVWSEKDNLQYGLLTWSWGSADGRKGAGQMTSVIYKQSRNCSTAGEARWDDLEEVGGDYEIDEPGDDDPIVEPGFFQQTSIIDLPIWAEDKIVLPEKPDSAGLREHLIEYHRAAAEFHEKWMDVFEGTRPPKIDSNPKPQPRGNGETFGL